jgi:hypothetical protein
MVFPLAPNIVHTSTHKLADSPAIRYAYPNSTPAAVEPGIVRVESGIVCHFTF